MPEEQTEKKLTIKTRRRHMSKLPKDKVRPPDIVFKPIETKEQALAAFKKMWRLCAPLLFGKVGSAKVIEAMAVAIKCARSYIDLSARGLSYVVTSKTPDEDILLLNQLQTQMGGVDTQKGRMKYFMAAQNIIYMWEALPNPLHHHRSICVDIELMRQEIAAVNTMLHDVLNAQSKDAKKLPMGYGAIGDSRNRMIANIKSLYETVGLTAKMMKDIKPGSDTGHALNRLQTGTTDKAVRLSSDGIGSLLAEIGESRKKPTEKEHIEPEEMPAAQRPDDLSEIDEKFINEAFKEGGNG